MPVTTTPGCADPLHFQGWGSPSPSSCTFTRSPLGAWHIPGAGFMFLALALCLYKLAPSLCRLAPPLSHWLSVCIGWLHISEAGAMSLELAPHLYRLALCLLAGSVFTAPPAVHVVQPWLHCGWVVCFGYEKVTVYLQFFSRLMDHCRH